MDRIAIDKKQRTGIYITSPLGWFVFGLMCLIVMLGAGVWFIYGYVVYLDRPFYQDARCLLGGIILIVWSLLLASVICWEHFRTFTLINKEGVYQKSFSQKENYLLWENCHYVGIVKGARTTSLVWSSVSLVTDENGDISRGYARKHASQLIWVPMMYISCDQIQQIKDCIMESNAPNHVKDNVSSI